MESPRTLARAWTNAKAVSRSNLTDSSSSSSDASSTQNTEKQELLQLYEEKLKAARKIAEPPLKELVEKLTTEIVHQNSEIILKFMNSLKTLINLLLSKNSITMQSYKAVIGEIMKLKDDKIILEQKSQICSNYLNQLLIILAQFSRLLGYLVFFKHFLQFCKIEKN